MIGPVARLMIPCEDARTRKGSEKKFDVFGVLTTINAPADAFPVRHSFSVFLSLTNGHGQGSGKVAVIEVDTEEAVFVSDPHAYDFGNDPMAIHGSTIRIPSCSFPRPGLYRIEFVYNDDVVVATYDLLVRET